MIKKNIVDLSLDDAERWMRGEALKIDAPSSSRYVVAKCGDVFLGAGRVGKDGLVHPQIPRNRLTRQGMKSAEDL
jgi:NOL1/NOP2/fmu family ribosome biogenesis protein